MSLCSITVSRPVTYFTLPRGQFFFRNTLRKFLMKSADSVALISSTMKSQNPAVVFGSWLVSGEARGA